MNNMYILCMYCYLQELETGSEITLQSKTNHSYLVKIVRNTMKTCRHDCVHSACTIHIQIYKNIANF